MALLLASTGGMMMSKDVSAHDKGMDYVYVSNAKSGTITRYLLDENKGKLIPKGATKTGDNVMPMSISPDKTHLYASIRSAPNRVISYRIDTHTGNLSQEGEAPLPASMANIDTDKTGRFLFAASYGSNLISVSSIEANGVVTGEAQQVQQTGRNAHAIHSSPDNRFVFSTSLGDDEIMQYCFDEQTGALTPNTPPAVKTAALDGPRHFLFSLDGLYLYVLGELSGTVSTYAYDAQTGLLTLKGAMYGVPPSITAESDEPKVWAADMHLSKNGHFLYVSERTKSIITTLSIDSQTGLPTYQDMIEVETQPRGFALSRDDRFMVVTGEKSANIGLYNVDQITGSLTKIDKVPTDDGANWVEIVSLTK